MKLHRPSLAVLVGCLLVCSVVQAEEVWKWVDRNGREHFSDTPRDGWTKVDIAPVASAATEPPEPGSEEALRAEECERKKKQLDTYKNATTIKERDALGRDREYTATERAQLLQMTQTQVEQACSPAVVTDEDLEEEIAPEAGQSTAEGPAEAVPVEGPGTGQ